MADGQNRCKGSKVQNSTYEINKSWRCIFERPKGAKAYIIFDSVLEVTTKAISSGLNEKGMHCSRKVLSSEVECVSG